MGLIQKDKKIKGSLSVLILRLSLRTFELWAVWPYTDAKIIS